MRTICVTGATGFLGRHLVQYLRDSEYWQYQNVVEWPSNLNLLNPGDVKHGFSEMKPDYVFHCAGYNGGILFNIENPADIFMRNTVMGSLVTHMCYKYGVKKLVSVVASCAYPAYNTDGQLNEIMYEEEFFDDEPHYTVSCHGYAKRNLQLLAKYYNKQYGLSAVCACPTTLFGPGNDYDEKRSKVMGALVKKIVDAHRAKADAVTLWGTGAAKREFLYVKDVSYLLNQTLLYYYDSYVPLNLGTGQELSIKDLAEMIVELVGFQGNIIWDNSKPDGQLRKRLDLEHMKKYIPDFRPLPLSMGIKCTIDDYVKRNPK